MAEREPIDVARLVEERDQLRQQLRQVQKMEGVGRLACGLAHDFNNMLTVIIIHTEMLLAFMEKNEAGYTNLAEIHNAAKRSEALTRQMLIFAQQQSSAAQLVPINEHLEGSIDMLRRLIGEGVEIDFEAGDGVGTVNMDPSQIDQIVTNLCINAKDAVGETGTGKIMIATRNVTVTDENRDDHREASPGHYVLLTVKDDGCGMDAETMSRVFDPFFTTKDVSEGSGLGLTTTQSLVREHGGAIEIRSTPEIGTTFLVYLPIHGDDERDREEAAPAKPKTSYGATVLLVEDEVAILNTVKLVLDSMGYRVFTASNPLQALEKIEAGKLRVDLLVSDIVMPGMSGWDLADQLKARFPEIKVIFMSGYPADKVKRDRSLRSDQRFIRKPFSFKDFRVVVRQILG